ncbi:MAG: LysR family transcriptional regulator [Alphaproteobacteria bacterium]|nr:LysR family transcriptional regulator [Alphaproteobacteria bacterium]
MSELSHMPLFVRVVEDGSFSAAARFLGITPSSVSRQVSQLESELGTRLFHRTTRKQSLTEAGNMYFQHARRIVADLDEARLALSRLTDTPSGRLHVTAEADFAVAFVAPILPEFLDRYPAIQLRFSLGAGAMDLVDSGIDLAIRMGHLDDSGLIARKIAMSRSVLCASPAYLAKRGTPRHPSELEAHSCLSFRTQLGKNRWSFQSPRGVIDVPISGCLNANSVVFLRDAALAGLGIIMVPTWIIGHALKRGHLVPLLEDFPLIPPSTPIHAVFAHNRHLAPKVRVFVDFLAQRIEPGSSAAA